MDSLQRAVLVLRSIAALLTSDVLTQRNNNERTGTTSDTTFNPATFSSGWRKRGELAISGRVYAQPLDAAKVQTPTGIRDLVFIVSSANQVAAFDAVSLARIWGPDSLGPSDQRALGNPRLVCDWISPEGIGVEATPVIDRALQRLYVSFRVNNSPGAKGPLAGKQMIRAMDIRTGERIGPDVEVRPNGFNAASCAHLTQQR